MDHNLINVFVMHEPIPTEHATDFTNTVNTPFYINGGLSVLAYKKKLKHVRIATLEILQLNPPL